ncbi:CsbD family protein [Sciscionella marina]|uniref:CsbD family protein n=1 Tax=Sciscionella marina TaxID=508770 RepID=UPI0003700379|nr:CsbD family protein [Sciscionella marina]
MDDETTNKAEELQGKAKEKAGEVTDNEQWQMEGKAQKTKGSLKQAGDKLRKALKPKR